jgi:hypothetical protein
MKAPKNLRVEQWPYPHLRDDEGCVLAHDYIDDEKVAFILDAVAEKSGRSAVPQDLGMIDRGLS